MFPFFIREFDKINYLLEKGSNGVLKTSSLNLCTRVPSYQISWKNICFDFLVETAPGPFAKTFDRQTDCRGSLFPLLNKPVGVRNISTIDLVRRFLMVWKWASFHK